jgi:hypothetical protein
MPENLRLDFSYFCKECDICKPTIDEQSFYLDFFERKIYSVRCEHATVCAFWATRLTKDQYEDQDDEPPMEHEVLFGKEQI